MTYLCEMCELSPMSRCPLRDKPNLCLEKLPAKQSDVGSRPGLQKQENSLASSKLCLGLVCVLGRGSVICLFFSLVYLLLAVLHGLWDISSPTRARTHSLGSVPEES